MREMKAGRARREYDRRYEQAALDKLRGDGRESDSGGAAEAAVGCDGSAADGGGGGGV